MRVRPSNVVCLLALPAFVPALAPFVAHWHWTLDLLACFPVQAMATLVVAAVALFAARRPRLALAYLLGAAAAAAALGRSGPLAGDAVAGEPLRVLCLNLLRGNEANLAQALAAVARHDPHVVFCSEVTPAWFAGLDTGLRDFPHRCHRVDPGYFGVALFSRLPLADAAVVPLAFDWAPAVRAVVTTAAGPVGVLGVHTPRPGSGRRNRERDVALAEATALLATLPQARLLLGDCNATPWNPSFRALLEASGLRAARRVPAATWPAQLPWPLRIPIDHVLVTEGLGVAQLTAGEPFGSDHLPLFAALRVTGASPR